MAAIISIDAHAVATWRMLELAQPGRPVAALGILLADPLNGRLHVRMRDAAAFSDLEEQEIDLLDALVPDLEAKARELGGTAIIHSVDEFSGFLRARDCEEIVCRGSAGRTADKLYEEYVDSAVRPFLTHVPVYPLRAAATRFGESMNANMDANTEGQDWLRVPPGMRLEPGMFAAQVVGRSMEPLIPDGSLCLFRTPVIGSRQGRRLLIEHFSETDFAARYTVKKYTSIKRQTEDGEWEHEQIRLEPLNHEFSAFNLAPDQFRVIAEFVDVLDS